MVLCITFQPSYIDDVFNYVEFYKAYIMASKMCSFKQI